MKKLCSTLIILIALTRFSAAQTAAAAMTLPNIISSSPDAAALGAFGDIQVDKGSGVPDISVPLYVVKTPRFNLPISVSYNATGIKVDQMATWIGLGWSLNAGGVITRTIIGKPDESGYLINTMPDINSTDFIQNVQLQDEMILGKDDYDPDYFFYNFNQHMGKFIFGQDKKPLQISSSPTKIYYNTSANTFTVTDEKGDTYLFNDQENESTSSPNGNIGGVTSWYLSQMISADKSDTIKFNYVAETQPLGEISYTYTQVVGLSSLTESTNYTCNTGPEIDPESITEVTRTSLPLRLSSIIFKGGKITFQSQTGRLDEPGITNLSDIAVLAFDYTTKGYTQIKDFKFNNSYFYSSLTNPVNPSLTNLQYRLRLDSIVESNSSQQAVETYGFGYNTLQPPPVNNFAQDIFGYYNGKTGNPTLLQTQTVFDGLRYFNIGEADRSADTMAMQAGILTAIHYPTKGYTQFTYEANRYIQNSQSTGNGSVSASASGGFPNQTDTVNFTPINFADPIVTVNISAYANLTPNVPYPPFVEIIDVTTGTTVYRNNGTPNSQTSLTFHYDSGETQLVPSHQYQLVTSAITANQSVYATISIAYTYPVNTPDTKFGGGLRVAKVQKFDSDNTLLTTDTYKYGPNESGMGGLISPPFALTTSFQFAYQYGWNTASSQGGVACFTCESSRTICSSSSQYALSTLGGSPIAYDTVTEYHGNLTTNIGKSVYVYDLFPDASLPVLPFYEGGVMITPNSWRNGQLKSQADYRFVNGQYTLVHTQNNSFFINEGPQGEGMKIGRVKILVGCYSDDAQNNGYFYYPIYTGVKLPSQTIESEYDATGQNVLVQKTTNYYYDNLAHLQPTRIVTTSSKGDALQQTLAYPQDMVNNGLDPTGVYSGMSNANMVSPVISVTNLKNVTQQLSQTITNYSAVNNSYEPQSIEYQKGTNAPEVRINYQSYDSNNNVSTVSKQGGPPIAYLWGYQKSYPIAEAKNATANDIFYDGFEEGTGNSSRGDSKTGHYSYNGSSVAYSKTLSGLDGGSYMLSYWLKSASTGVWSLVYTPITVPGTTNSTYTINISGQIDDVRFYPVGAQMTSYTYDPQIGVTSVTDAKDEVNYYEYDTFQRLLNIKDKDGNIIKNMIYHYQGQ